MSARAIWGRALAAVLLHLLLLAAWPLFEPVYAPAFRTLVEFALGVAAPLPGALEIRLEPGSGGLLAQDIVRMDTIVSLRPRVLAGVPATFGASSFFHGYLPLCALLALFGAALPRPWSARRRPLLWALALLHVAIVLRFLPALYYCYSKCSIDGRSPLGLGPDGTRALQLGKHFAFDDMVPNALVPLCLFALCAFGPRSRSAART